MPFVVEKMPEEAKAGLPFKVCIDFNGKRPTLSHWAIDKDHDAYIVLVKKVGGSFEGTQETKHYVLKWQSHLISISADPLKPTFNEAGATMHWMVYKIELPSGIDRTCAEIRSFIQQAFKAVGKFFDGKNYVDVQVAFQLD